MSVNCFICKMFDIRSRHDSCATASEQEKSDFAKGLKVLKEGSRITDLIGKSSDYTPELLNLMSGSDYISYLEYLNE